MTRAERSQGGTVSHRSRYVPHGPDAAAVEKGTDLDTSKPERCGDPGLVGIDHWLGAQTGVRFGWIFFHLYTHTHRQQTLLTDRNVPDVHSQLLQ